MDFIDDENIDYGHTTMDEADSEISFAAICVALNRVMKDGTGCSVYLDEDNGFQIMKNGDRIIIVKDETVTPEQNGYIYTIL
jgi:hypothetical protein